MIVFTDCLKKLFVLAFFLAVGAVSFSQSIKGKVTDAKTGEPLVGATVLIEHTHYAAIVNLDGSFVFKNLPAGTYELKVQSLGYEASQGKEVVVEAAHPVLNVSFKMETETKELSTVSVVGRMNGETDNGVRKMEKNADLLENVLSAKTIQLSPDVTVANALQRISGVTIQRSSSGEGRYAIIRGMDERYNTTLVNGVKIPSPDAKYRYIPMDLFPSDMLERLEVIKSLTPSMEGDAVGGTMNLVMKSAPANFLLTAHAGTGLSTLFSSSRPFATYQHGAVNPSSPAELFGNNYSATQNDFSRANLNFTNRNQPFNSVAGLTIGGRVAKNRLGIIVSGAYQNMFRGSNTDFLVPNAQPQVVGTADNQAVISDLYIRKYSTQTTRWGLHNKLDYIINDRNRISLYNMYVHMNEFQTRSTYDSVYLNKLSDNLLRSRTQQQSIYSSTLQGDHLLGHQFRVNWIGSYAIAKGAIPDMAEYDVQSKGAGVFIVENMNRQWQHNTDKNLAGYLNMYYTPTIGNSHTELSFGGMYRHKSRDNYFNDYSLSPVLTNSQPQVFTNFNSANYVFSPVNLGTGAVSTANPNTYTSYEDVAAGYAQLKFMATPNLQVLGGARIEYTKQGFTTIMPKSFTGRAGTVEYADLLPSAQLKYALTDRANLRLSYFKSIVRPDFYEIIPTQIVGEVFDTKGNDSLRHTQADNIDLRYEFFPGGADQLLIGAFYKNIQDPIEYAVVRNGGPSAQYFMPENFGVAHNYGVEAVLTKYFGMFGVSANYTYTQSRITTTKQFFYRDPTLGITSKIVNQTRPLQGQADNIGNFSLLYKNPKTGTDIQVAFVYTGKRIAQVSPYYELDYWMLGQGTLDFSFEQRLAGHFTLYGKVNNLTNSPAKTVLQQAPPTDQKFPDQNYSDKMVVGKDIYQINILAGIRYKF